MKGELLEQVVVEPRAGSDAHASCPIQPEPHAHSGLRSRANMANAASRHVVVAGEHPEQQIVVLAIAHGDPDPASRQPDDAAAQEKPGADLHRVGGRDEDEVRARRQGLEPECAQLRREPVALFDDVRDIRRCSERGKRERDRQRRHGRRRLTRAKVRRRIALGEQIADARTGETERLRERADDDHAVVEQRHRRLARVLEVGLVDDERARRRKSLQVAEWIARPTAERQDGVVVADGRPRELRGHAKERIRGIRGDRDDVAGAGEGPSAEQDEVVSARAEHHVLRLDARVVGDRLVDQRVAAVGVGVDVGERRGDRPGTRARQRQRGDVAVEADDLHGIEARPRRERVGRLGPLVRPEPRCKLLHRATACACAGMPSTAASSSTVERTRASPAALSRCTVNGFRNVSSPRPPTDRAQPFVGRT